VRQRRGGSEIQPRFRVRYRYTVLGVVAALVVACTTNAIIHLGDGGPDAGMGTGSDGGPDAGDAGSDAGATDGGLDAGADAGLDAGPDAGLDAGTDAGPDGGVDGGSDAGPDAGGDGGATAVAVTTFGNSATRSGVYVDSAITKAVLALIDEDGGLKPDPNFAPMVLGKVYAQPLFLEKGVQGEDAILVVTEADNVYAFDADGGGTLWSLNVGLPGSLSQLGCGNIDPLGITGTPALDVSRNQLLLDAVIEVAGAGLPDAGKPHHAVFAVDLTTGTVNWSIDIDEAISGFDTRYQNERSALLVVGDTLYVPYGGYYGDCGNYHGRVVGIPLTVTPPTAASLELFQTTGTGSALWAPNALASDGQSLFICTGNATSGPTVWDGGMSEAVIRLPLPSLGFSWQTTDYFSPNDWQTLDSNDADLGSNGVVLFDLPDAGSGHLVFAIGKTLTGWLLDRDNLGGINTPDAPLASIQNVATADASGGMVAYQTTQAAYVGYNAPCWQSGNTLAVLKVTPGSPPTLSEAFCVSQGVGGEDTGGSPIVTTSDGTNDAVLWGLGVRGTDQLYAYDGDTGVLLTQSKGLTQLTHWIAPIVAKGTMYVAGNQQVFAIHFK
jgi:hypothetical protein